MIPLNYIVNFFKGGTFLYVLLLMYNFNNYSNGMILYFFIHGSYGWAWIYKDIFFPDASFRIKGTIGSSILVCVFLIIYWSISLPLALGLSNNSPSIERMIYCSVIYIVGVALMLGADYQKTKTLEKRKGINTVI